MTKHTDTSRSSDLVEREPIEDYLRRKAKWVEPEFDIVEQHRLLEAADRIEALEAEVDRLLRRRSKNYEPFWENPDGPNAA